VSAAQGTTTWQKWRQRVRKATAFARALPDFVILGGMKCGTTSLYAALGQHPQVVLAQMKETHYFDHNYIHGPRWYRAVFPLRPYLLAKKLFCGGPVLTGEATPYYLFHPHVPGRLHAALPHVKLIALLRDPVARAYSHFRHNQRFQLEPLSFEDALAAEAERLRCDRACIARNELHLSENYWKYSYLARGIYADQVAAYFALFPRHQLLTIRSEDYFADPAQTLRQVFEFLGLDNELPPGFSVRTKTPGQPAPTATAARLYHHFAPHNARLYELLGTDLGWDRQRAYRALAA